MSLVKDFIKELVSFRILTKLLNLIHMGAQEEGNSCKALFSWLLQCDPRDRWNPICPPSPQHDDTIGKHSRVPAAIAADLTPGRVLWHSPGEPCCLLCKLLDSWAVRSIKQL